MILLIVTILWLAMWLHASYKSWKFFGELQTMDYTSLFPLLTFSYWLAMMVFCCRHGDTKWNKEEDLSFRNYIVNLLKGKIKVC